MSRKRKRHTRKLRRRQRNGWGRPGHGHTLRAGRTGKVHSKRQRPSS